MAFTLTPDLLDPVSSSHSSSPYGLGLKTTNTVNALLHLFQRLKFKAGHLTMTLYFHQKTIRIISLALSIDYSICPNYRLDYLSLSLVCFYLTFILFYCALMWYVIGLNKRR